MSRSKPPRKPPAKPTAAKGGVIPNTPQNITLPQSLPPNRRRVLFHPRLIRNLTRAWKVASVIFGIIALAIAWRPLITIEPSVNLDTSEPLGMQFKITNSGKLPLSDVSFGCLFNMPPMITNNLAFGGRGQEPVKWFPSNQSVTRGCSNAVTGLHSNAAIDMIVYFHWPYIGMPDHARAHFTTRRSRTGEFVLVPDIER
jgi:hypothetical protein